MSSGGLPFFPLDCQLDDKFELIEAEFGIKGFAVVVKLLQKIYGGEGYYCEWTKDVSLLFSKNINEGSELVSEIVRASIRRGIFSKELYDKYQILTSAGIQKRYLKAAGRRQSVTLKKEYLLVKVDQNYKNVDISSENVYISEENADISEQRREEDRREEKRKEEYSIGEDFARDAKNDTDFTVETVDNFFEPVPFQKISNTDVVQAMSLFHSMFPEDGADDVEIAEWMTEYMRCPPGEIRERLESAKKNGETDWKGVRAWLLG